MGNGVALAIAGGATTAYNCKIVDGVLHVGDARMVGRATCPHPSQAAERLLDGQMVIVAGSDMVAVRELVKTKGVRG